MSIKTQLLLVITFIFCASIVFSVSINISLQNYREAVKKTGNATDIVSEVFEKRLLVDDFILYSGERARDQWFLKHNNLMQIITSNKSTVTTIEEKELLNTIEDRARHSEEVFSELVYLEERSGTISASINEKNIRLARQLSGSSQETISAAKMLYGLYNKSAEQALQQIIIVFSSAAILFFSMLLGSFWIIWRSTDKLDRERAKDEAILSSVGDGLVALNLEGKVTLANKAVEELVGWKPEELLGQIWTEKIPIVDVKGEKVQDSKRPFGLVLKEGKTVESNQFSYVKKDSHIIPVAITVSPIISAGNKLGVIEVFRDITREREVDRMKTEFISLASHQLRTPLTAMKWYLELLLSGDMGKVPSEQLELIHNVNESNERMIELVNALLNISRIESGRIIVDPVPTDLGKMMKEVQSDLTAKIEAKHQHFTVNVNPDLPIVNVDKKLIRQVYMNILSNAIKYTPAAGDISVSIWQKDNQIISQISDNGYGIPAKDHDKVYQKFYRGDNVVKLVTDGNGLGMYLAKFIVDSSHGKIWFESEENKGTTFWFSIPVSGMKAKKGEVTLNS